MFEIEAKLAVLKANRVDITKSPVPYKELIKLRDFRNTITHYAGMIERSDNANIALYSNL